MTEQTTSVENNVGKCLSRNWVEERAVAALNIQETRTQIQKQGHTGILTIDQESKMETVTTQKEAYVPPKSPGVRQRGIRGELLEKDIIAQMIREKADAEQNTQIPKTDYCSTTQKDFCVEGFVPFTPETTQAPNYITDQAITFWSENCLRIQGVTAMPTLTAPFRKWALFSTPISERLDEMELPPEN